MNKFQILDDGLKINKISKTYGNKKVVRDISISINRREVVGLLGPNGAGKTTTFYIIVGLLSVTLGLRRRRMLVVIRQPRYTLLVFRTPFV